MTFSPFSLFWIKIWYNVHEAIWVTNIWSLDMNKQTNYQQQLSDGRNVLCRKKRRRKIICQVKLNRWPKMRSNRKYSTGVYGFTRYYSSNLFILANVRITIGYYKGYTPSTRVWRTVPTKYVWCVSVDLCWKKIFLGTF